MEHIVLLSSLLPLNLVYLYMRAPFARARSDFWYTGPGAAVEERTVYETAQT